METNFGMKIIENETCLTVTDAVFLLNSSASFMYTIDGVPFFKVWEQEGHQSWEWPFIPDNRQESLNKEWKKTNNRKLAVTNVIMSTRVEKKEVQLQRLSWRMVEGHRSIRNRSTRNRNLNVSNEGNSKIKKQRTWRVLLRTKCLTADRRRQRSNHQTWQKQRSISWKRKLPQEIPRERKKSSKI